MLARLRKLLRRFAAQPSPPPWPWPEVKISPKASLFGVAGMTLGAGTQIYPEAVVACSYLQFDDTPGMPPVGQITLGRGCTVLKGAILASYGGRIIIGDGVHLNPGVVIYGHGGVAIGSGTAIATGSVIIPANHNFSDPSTPFMEQGWTAEGISVGKDVWIGARVVVLDGVHIGHGCVIGAGAVVNRNLPDFAIAVGVPAKVIGTRNRPVARP